MIRKLNYDEIVAAVDALTADEQADLVQLMQRRLAAIGRHRVINEVREAQRDAEAGRVERYDPQSFLTGCGD